MFCHRNLRQAFWHKPTGRKHAFPDINIWVKKILRWWIVVRLVRTTALWQKCWFSWVFWYICCLCTNVDHDFDLILMTAFIDNMMQCGIEMNMIIISMIRILVRSWWLHLLMTWLRAAVWYWDDHDHDFDDFDYHDFDLILINASIDDMIESCSEVFRWSWSWSWFCWFWWSGFWSDLDNWWYDWQHCGIEMIMTMILMILIIRILIWSF